MHSKISMKILFLSIASKAKGLEILNISNSSNMPKDDLKYFEKKAKKISQYIKECNNYLIFLDHDKLNEYPSTIINFYKIGRVRN